MKNITIYSTPVCTFCQMAKEYFKEKGLEYTEHNVGADLDKRKEMIDKSGQMGVPVIDIDGKILVGFDKAELESALA
jgi:glutaredoxin 3